MTPFAWLVLLVAVVLVSRLLVFLGRRDLEATRRTHPGPDEGGRSFGDTTHWGGHGRPGA